MAFQCRFLCLSALAGVVSSVSSNSTTSLRGAVLAEEACRLAVKGEECYEHVYWAMVHGMKLHPERYEGLTTMSSFAEFQAYLHKINHGDCPAPCLKKRCCAQSGCRFHAQEYDPATEECCGEGIVTFPKVVSKDGCCVGIVEAQEYDPATEHCCGERIVAVPTVCSKDLGCCVGRGMSSGTPKCFDRGSKQCCGVNFPSEMPVVCSLDVACPKESFSWRQCSSAGAAAAFANSSSNAEAGKQLFLP